MSKFVIGICEDEECVHDIVNNLLDRYANMRNIEYEVIPFLSGMELLESTQEMDMLFLDIAMPGLDGIKTARKLNVRGISYKIVLLTGKTEYLKEGYKVGAFRFVTKPIAEEEFFEAVDDVRDMGKIEIMTVAVLEIFEHLYFCSVVLKKRRQKASWEKGVGLAATVLAFFALWLQGLNLTLCCTSCWRQYCFF